MGRWLGAKIISGDHFGKSSSGAHSEEPPKVIKLIGSTSQASLIGRRLKVRGSTGFLNGVSLRRCVLEVPDGAVPHRGRAEARSRFRPLGVEPSRWLSRDRGRRGPETNGCKTMGGNVTQGNPCHVDASMLGPVHLCRPRMRFRSCENGKRPRGTHPHKMTLSPTTLLSAVGLIRLTLAGSRINML